MTDHKNDTIVAAFDFDKTITTKDSLIVFLWYSVGMPRFLLNIVKCLPAFIAYFLKIMRRGKTKEYILKQFFGGRPYSWILDKAAHFSQEKIPSLLLPQAMQRLQWHKEQGHRCFLVSGTLEIYLKPWAEKAGFDGVIATQLELTPQNTITGRLKDGNCYGPEKQRRLENILGKRDSYTLYAYGDSRGDKELLAMADHPFYRKMPT
jgi:phosphatidylglycerophosphatase C